MKKVGVIFLSLGATEELRDMTQKAIDSCLDGDPDIEYRVVVFESEEDVEYENAYTIHPIDDDSFNYNKRMNICRGLPIMDDCEYFALCNNDLVFEKGWASTLIKKMIEHKSWSACPKEPTVHAEVKFENGVNAGRLITVGERHIAGWCIFQDRRIYKFLGRLNEQPVFWHSDSYYAFQLAKDNLKHILVEDAVVHHLNSKTIGSDVIPKVVFDYYTTQSEVHEFIRDDYIRMINNEER